MYPWNKLYTDCVQASSVIMFKNRIDKYLVRATKYMCNLDKRPSLTIIIAIIDNI